jgi:DNA replication protein DnaC
MNFESQMVMKTHLQKMLVSLNLSTMADELDTQLSDPLFQEFSKLEFIFRLVKEEYVSRNNHRTEALMKRAGLSKTQADLSNIDYSIDRKLNRDLISQLASCDFIADKKNLCILGAAGSGKSFFAKGFGVEACHNLYRTRYTNAHAFLNELYHLQQADTKRFERKLRYFQRLPVLILDDWLMFDIRDQVKEAILLDLIDARYGTATTIVCSQVVPDDWCDKFSGYTIGNAITSRLVANGFSLVIQSDTDLRIEKYPGEN